MGFHCSIGTWMESTVKNPKLIFLFFCSDREEDTEKAMSEDEAPPQARIIESDDEEIPSTPQPETK